MGLRHRTRIHVHRGVAGPLAAVVLLATLSGTAGATEGGEPGTSLRLPPGALAAPATPARPRSDPKLDTPLADLAAARDDRSGLRAAARAGLAVDGDRVEVTVVVEPGSAAAVRTVIEATGGKPGAAANGGQWLEALLPRSALRRLAARADVQRLRVPDVAIPEATPRMGTFMTEGDLALNGPAWRSAGWYGDGVRIGIIDIGFLGYAELLDTELPTTVTTRNFIDNFPENSMGGSEHGAAVAEIVHDVAPNAQLFLARIRTAVDFEEAADWLVDTHAVDIVSTSISFLNVTRGDGTGFFETIVAEKRAMGTIWFTAASNYRRQHWGGSFSDTDRDRFHEFEVNGTDEQEIDYIGDGTGSALTIPAGRRISVRLRWNDWNQLLPHIDFDLILYRFDTVDDVWTEVARSDDSQNGGIGQTPTEAIDFDSVGEVPAAYGFAIRRISASGAATLEVFTPRYDLDERLRQRSLGNLSDAASAVTIGAVDAEPSYLQEVYSSEGPTNGAGGSATGGQQKPDLAAYANVATDSYGTSSPFNGTSAATPHAAGAAALLLDASPTLTPSQIETYLVNNAVDLGVAGPDNLYGAGRLWLGHPPTNPAAPPRVTAPTPGFRSGPPGTTDSRVGTGTFPIPVRISWTATDSDGVNAVQLQSRQGDAPFSDSELPTPTSTSVTFQFRLGNASPGSLTQFRTRATDNDALVSPWATGMKFKIGEAQDSATSVVQYTGSWRQQTNSSSGGFYGTTVRYTSSAGATASYSVVAKEIAFVTTYGSDRGRVGISIDGARETILDLYRPGLTMGTRQIAFRRSFPAPGVHSIVIRALGTRNPASSGTRVDMDAFLTILP